MFIKEIRSQSRRDIYGTLQCECCGHGQKFVGYDDDNYHRNVVPSIKCKSCGKSAKDVGANAKPMTPKYGPNEVV